MGYVAHTDACRADGWKTEPKVRGQSQPGKPAPHKRERWACRGHSPPVHTVRLCWLSEEGVGTVTWECRHVHFDHIACFHFNGLMSFSAPAFGETSL